MSSYRNWDKHIETPTMYLLSDFPVAPVDYKHLAKLVLYAALSKESKRHSDVLLSFLCVFLLPHLQPFLQGPLAQRGAVVDLVGLHIVITDDELSKEQRIAIQLSHNAIVGQDDPDTLKKLYDEIFDTGDCRTAPHTSRPGSSQRRGQT